METDYRPLCENKVKKCLIFSCLSVCVLTLPDNLFFFRMTLLQRSGYMYRTLFYNLYHLKEQENVASWRTFFSSVPRRDSHHSCLFLLAEKFALFPARSSSSHISSSFSSCKNTHGVWPLYVIRTRFFAFFFNDVFIILKWDFISCKRSIRFCVKHNHLATNRIEVTSSFISQQKNKKNPNVCCRIIFYYWRGFTLV